MALLSLPPILRRFWPWLAVLGLLLLLVAVFVGTGAYRTAKEWRARSLAGEAVAAAERGDWAEASAQARHAILLAPEDAETLRQLAGLQRRLNPRLALAYYEQLVALPGATAQDKRHLTRVTLAAGRPGEAWQMANALLQADPLDAANRDLAVEVALRSGHRVEAITMLRRLLMEEPESRKLHLQLGLALLGEKEWASEARGHLERAADGQDGTSLQALEGLARLTPEEEGAMLARRLREHPLARPEHHYVALVLDAPPGQEKRRRDWLRERVMQTARESGEPEAWMRLLMRNGFPDLAVQLVPDPDGLTQSDLLVWLDAGAMTGDWEAIREVLERNDVPLSNSVREVFLARSALELGDAPGASLHWTRARLAAGDSFQELTYVATYAERLGQSGIARDVYQAMAQRPQYERYAYTELVRLLELRKDTAALLELYREMVARFPHDAAMANDLLYLQLLLGQGPGNAVERAAARVADNPRMMANRVTLALAHLRAGQPAEGLAQYAPVRGRIGELLPGWQAVYAGLLSAAGQEGAAADVVRGIPLHRLKPEERRLLAPAGK